MTDFVTPDVRDGIPPPVPPVLSEGRSRGLSWPVLAVLIGVGYLALIGFAVTVDTIYGWIF